MSMRKTLAVLVFLGLALGAATTMAADRPGLGKPVTEADLALWDISIGPEGAGLPPGSGTPEQGASIFAGACASCHGANGEGKGAQYPQLIGGPKGAFNFASDYKIPRTIGNYWPYATTVWDYIHRGMPAGNEGTLTANEVYSLTAYLLFLNKVIPEDEVLDKQSLPKVKMPIGDDYAKLHEWKPNTPRLEGYPF